MGWEGSFLIRKRCFTVGPPCTSPSTPNPASKVMLSRFGLLNAHVPLLLTAAIVLLMGKAHERGAGQAFAAHVRSAALLAKSATFLSSGSSVYWWKRHLALMRGLPAET